jgi:hypothetical protein
VKTGAGILHKQSIFEPGRPLDLFPAAFSFPAGRPRHIFCGNASAIAMPATRPLRPSSAGEPCGGPDRPAHDSPQSEPHQRPPETRGEAISRHVAAFQPLLWYAWRKAGGKMSAKAPEDVIIRAIHEAFIKYPEGDGGPNLDYEWVHPEQSSHVAKAILLELAANGFEIVKKGA